ncbi:hypothetical protein PAEPH01_2266 [Pancytospora epiphaga]|nr:hypothetical protein PAEPH01_2266 [Pancytospora epiphaga]
MGEAELRNPFVVQCKECNRILSDSFTLQSVKHGYLIHTHAMVQPVGDVALGDGLFENCMLRDVKCRCGVDVGRFLVSVSNEWNGYAEMYGFDKEKIISYVLGNESYREKGVYEMADDIEKLKVVMSKIYRKVYQ